MQFLNKYTYKYIYNDLYLNIYIYIPGRVHVDFDNPNPNLPCSAPIYPPIQTHFDPNHHLTKKKGIESGSMQIRECRSKT